MVEAGKEEVAPVEGKVAVPGAGAKAAVVAVKAAEMEAVAEAAGMVVAMGMEVKVVVMAGEASGGRVAVEGLMEALAAEVVEQVVLEEGVLLVDQVEKREVLLAEGRRAYCKLVDTNAANARLAPASTG